MFEHFGAILKQWWAMAIGGVFSVWGVWETVKSHRPISLWLFFGLVIVLVAQFFEGVALRRQLKPRLRITRITEMYQKPALWYRFEVENLGLEKIGGVRVELIDIAPTPADFRGIFPLQLRPKDRPNFTATDTFELGGEERRPIDLMVLHNGAYSNSLVLQHVVAQAPRALPEAIYTLRIRVTGNGVPAKEEQLQFSRPSEPHT